MSANAFAVRKQSAPVLRTLLERSSAAERNDVSPAEQAATRPVGAVVVRLRGPRVGSSGHDD